MEHSPLCPDCKHSLENNLHGFDQNDWTIDETGTKLVYLGSCTYCKICNPRLKELTKQNA